ncbi:NAD(P)H-quinone oxidoreductase [Occultella glacieicola]|uniref:NAD(P)H-quinone oxidoreductase n=1 Tax=Occultella glacieicola TaxID=2518684 RepID=A0ABY2E0P4_9MICO|nr:NAD(P)H-quinone oxidoreductase [Occultella glacieicola]TDE91526.1 NAD(P)H-quinone oxidoreductase [Occultella glacieicola]
MRAVLTTGTGGPEVLSPTDVPDPTPGHGEVLIDVAAAGVNRADLLQLKGHHPPPPGAPEWPGLEASGTIAALGPGVTGWSVGDRVCALLDGGGYASKAVASAALLLPVPAGLDLVDAAGLPEAICTAWSNLAGVAGLTRESAAGATVLVHGGSGGVGTTSILLLKALGARVLTTAGGPDRVARCVALGADVGIDHRAEDFAEVVQRVTEGAGVDVILDVVGAGYLERNLASLARLGQLVIIAAQQGTRATLDIGSLMGRWAGVHGSLLRKRPRAEKEAIVAAVREQAWPLVTSGDVYPVVHERLPLDRAADAHRLLADGAVFGKLLLVP